MLGINDGIDIRVNKATSYATAQRHAHQLKAQTLGKAKIRRSTTEPTLGRNPAENQMRGFNRLATLGTAHRRMVSLLGIANPNPRPHLQSPTSTAEPTIPQSLSPAEEVENEKQAVLLDHAVAEKELSKYVARGIENGTTLIHYWNVCSTT
ncbi:hypothetical protein BD779DRAFT_819175 [Infundibulicybe gibba]|nr:hypothetical protein BD779DRAFT_819175 [Infundibulicybe gibba]